MKNPKANTNDIPSNEFKLFLGLELGKKQWKLCFSDGDKIRFRSVQGGNAKAVIEEIELCKRKFKMPLNTPVWSCFEAGRDGFWLHRYLEQSDIFNKVFDSSSIEVNRRSKQTKTDKVDAEKLVRLLMRIVLWGESKVCAVVRVPTEEQEAQMRTGRERERLVKERVSHLVRIRSLLKLKGIEVGGIKKLDFRKLLDPMSNPLPEEMIVEMEHERDRMKLAEEQIKEVENVQKQTTSEEENLSEVSAKVVKLMSLRGIGPQTAWFLAHEFFWRKFKNRKEVGACAGLTGCPYDSGEMRKEQGISKAGSRRVRTCCVEMAWNWVRFQPESNLTQWFKERCGAKPTSRTKRIGIMAMARKLLIALWKYIEQDQMPEGAI
jgi:transposase